MASFTVSNGKTVVFNGRTNALYSQKIIINAKNQGLNYRFTGRGEGGVMSPVKEEYVINISQDAETFDVTIQNDQGNGRWTSSRSRVQNQKGDENNGTLQIGSEDAGDADWNDAILYVRWYSATVTKDLVVNGTDTWLDTGLDVKAGDQMLITATGTWIYEPRPQEEWVGADGDNFSYDLATLPTANLGSLIGRIGVDGEPFVIGSNFNGISPGSGRLYLQMNDVPNSFSDNDGELAVAVEIRP